MLEILFNYFPISFLSEHNVFYCVEVNILCSKQITPVIMETKSLELILLCFLPSCFAPTLPLLCPLSVLCFLQRMRNSRRFQVELNLCISSLKISQMSSFHDRLGEFCYPISAAGPRRQGVDDSWNLTVYCFPLWLQQRQPRMSYRIWQIWRLISVARSFWSAESVEHQSHRLHGARMATPSQQHQVSIALTHGDKWHYGIATSRDMQPHSYCQRGWVGIPDMARRETWAQIQVHQTPAAVSDLDFKVWAANWLPLTACSCSFPPAHSSVCSPRSEDISIALVRLRSTVCCCSVCLC